MWGVVLALALVAAADPVRIGITVLLFSKPRPTPHLFALWLGGLAVGGVLNLAALFGLRELVLGVTHRLELVTASSAAGHIQIVLGVLALVLAAVITVGLSARQRPPAPATPRAAALSRAGGRAVGALQAGPPWTTFLLGTVIFADLRYLAALTAILASGATVDAQLGAAGLYAVVSLAYVEIPLVCQWVAPAKTRAAVSSVHRWARARRREVLGALVAVLGIFLAASGLGYV